MEKNYETIEGKVIKKLFIDDKTGYTIASCENHDKNFIVKGKVSLFEGNSYVFHGKNSTSYFWCEKAVPYKKEKDSTVKQKYIEKYLTQEEMFIIRKNYKDKDPLPYIKGNPYLLCGIGVSFKSADKIALKLNVPANAAIRYDAYILDLLKKARAYGFSFVEVKKLKPKMPESVLKKRIWYLLISNKIRLDYDEKTKTPLRIYLKEVYDCENTVINHLIQRCKTLNRNAGYASLYIKEIIRKVERDCKITYEEAQRKALSLVNQNLLLITGGPGTGKTTVIRGIINVIKYISPYARIALTAPTGKAADKLSKTTGMEASTLHRLLGYQSESFYRDERNPLDYDYVIIDECSMVATNLFAALLNALKPETKLILVGDPGQLPPVESSPFFSEIIKTSIIPHVELKVIKRQGKGSGIVKNALAIKQGSMPSPADDFIILERNDDELIDTLIEQAKQYTSDTQILLPMNEGPFGTIKVNKVLQECLTPGEGDFRKGDKVINIVNDPNIKWWALRDGEYYETSGGGVFNGEIGYIENIINDTVYVSYPEKIIKYDAESLPMIKLAYAITIHKSQGSEWENVIILIADTKMIDRKLLYTAVTRAKSKVILIAKKDAIFKAIQEEDKKVYTVMGNKLLYYLKNQLPDGGNII